jgi:hypothetical protein
MEMTDELCSIIANQYVCVSADNIKIYDSVQIKEIRGLMFPGQVIIVPFHDQQRWDGKLPFVDSSRVGANGDQFLIYRHYIGPNMEYRDSLWMQPYVGQVKAKYFHYDFAPFTRYRWELKRYSLH